METMGMENQEAIVKWLRIICLYVFFSFVANASFYVLVYLGIINETLSTFDMIDLIYVAISTLVILTGLWRFKPWGWKSAVLLIPIALLIDMYGLISVYERGMGVIAAPFVAIDGAVMRYLFRENVMRFCGVSSALFFKLKWTASGFFLYAAFLFVNDIFGAIVAICLVIAVAMGLAVSKRQKNRIRDMST
jgi:hypothetical protein